MVCGLNHITAEAEDIASLLNTRMFETLNICLSSEAMSSASAVIDDCDGVPGQ